MSSQGFVSWKEKAQIHFWWCLDTKDYLSFHSRRLGGTEQRPRLNIVIYQCISHTIALPCGFWCNALILIHSRKIHICNANFCGDLYFQLQPSIIGKLTVHVHRQFMPAFSFISLEIPLTPRCLRGNREQVWNTPFARIWGWGREERRAETNLTRTDHSLRIYSHTNPRTHAPTIQTSHWDQ